MAQVGLEFLFYDLPPPPQFRRLHNFCSLCIDQKDLEGLKRKIEIVGVSFEMQLKELLVELHKQTLTKVCFKLV